MVRIVADSTCDLGGELARRLGVAIVPLYVVLGDKSYKDGVEVGQADVFEWAVASKATPKTTAPSPEDMYAAFEPVVRAGDDLVFFGVSEDMSATCDIARSVGERFDKGRITVVNTRNITGGIGLLVCEAAEMAKNGASAREIAQMAEGMIPWVRTSFVIDTLTYLYRGGRCSALAALSAMALKIKPEIIVDNGAMRPNAKFRGKREHVVERYVTALMPALQKANSKRVFIVHTFDNAPIVGEVCERVKAMNRFDEVVVTPASCVISCHCGPGTLGVIYAEK